MKNFIIRLLRIITFPFLLIHVTIVAFVYSPIDLTYWLFTGKDTRSFDLFSKHFDFVIYGKY